MFIRHGDFIGQLTTIRTILNIAITIRIILYRLIRISLNRDINLFREMEQNCIEIICL